MCGAARDVRFGPKADIAKPRDRSEIQRPRRSGVVLGERPAGQTWISDPACRFVICFFFAALLVSKRIFEKVLVSFLKLILKAKDLKAIVSTDGPKLELRPVSIPCAGPIPIAIGIAIAGIAYEEAWVTSYTIHRSIGIRVP